MYKILLLTRGDGKLDLRQTPKGLGIFNGKYQFYINEPIEDPDFLVIRGKALAEKSLFNIARSNTILLTSEPYSVLSYPLKYCKQFGVVCSCQEEIKLPNVVHTPAMLPWFVGVEFGKNGQSSVRLNYEDIKESHPQKTKLISVITSNKAFTQGHLDRLRFVEKLQNYYGDQIDVFGRGYHDFADKWDVLSPYKYHIAIENSSSKYYWTEKLSDCYLAGTYPFYYGCKNVNDYFPEDALTRLDIYNPEQAIECINKVIENKTFSIKQKELLLCKKLVMENYNMFNYIVDICSKLDAQSPKEVISLNPASHYFDFHNLYLYTIGRNVFKLKRKFQKCSRNNHGLGGNI